MNRSAAIDIALVVLGGFVAAETLLGIYSLVSPLIDSPSLALVFTFTPFWFSSVEAAAGVVLTLVGYYRWKHRKQLTNRKATEIMDTRCH